MSELLMAPEDDKGVDEQSMPTVLQMAPEEPIAAAVIHAQLEPEPMPLMQILPADFKLPALLKFIPNPEVKVALQKAHEYALSIEIEGKGRDGIALADSALSELAARIKRAEQEFEEPAAIAYDLHRQVTSTRANWVNGARDDYKRIGQKIWREDQRLKDEDAKERRRLQDEANAKARKEAEERLAAAKKNAAPAPVVEKLEQQAKTVTAPPVVAPSAAAGPLMTDNSVITVWKAKLASTPDDVDDAHIDITKLSPAEIADLKTLLKAIIDGRTDLLCAFSIEWGALDKLAAAQEATFNVPGFVAYKTGGTRKKPARKAR